MTQFIDPQPTPEVPSTISEPLVAPAPPAKPALIAPLWHTLLISALILGNSFLGSSKVGAVKGSGSRILLYGGTFVTQLILILLIWFGIRLRGARMRDLIGGRWKTVEAFLLDAALAFGFWITSLLVLFGIRVALGTIDLHNMQKSVDDTVRILGPMAPHTYLEAGLFVLLSVCAGLFEEIIFRGYLQRQFGALGRNAIIGIVASGHSLWSGARIPRHANDGCDRILWNFLRHTGAPAEEPAARHDGARLPGFHCRHWPFQARYPALIVLCMHRLCWKMAAW